MFECLIFFDSRDLHLICIVSVLIAVNYIFSTRFTKTCRQRFATFVSASATSGRRRHFQDVSDVSVEPTRTSFSSNAIICLLLSDRLRYSGLALMRQSRGLLWPLVHPLLTGLLRRIDADFFTR